VLRIAFLLLSLPVVAHGAEALYYAVRSRDITTVTCDQLTRAVPSARWLRVTGCDIDYMHPAFTQSDDRVNSLYFAMRPRGAPADAAVSLIVATRDPAALSAAQPVLTSATPIDEETFTVAMLRVVNVLHAAREVQGFVRSGMIERLLARRELAGFNAPLAPDAIVLDVHARPSLARPVIETSAGLVLAAAAVVVSSRRRDSADDVGRGFSPANDERAPQTLTRRLPPAMLLDLDASAPISEIEHAPPLGDEEDVVARIAGVLGPLTREDDGTYRAGGSDWMLTFDVGRDPIVWTVVVGVHGSEAADEALERLARDTTWRVFIPRLGTFR
jgi:hypothetical protein